MCSPDPKSIYTLAKLQYFNPAVFISDDKEEQKVCDFILALAFIYNDFCDLLFIFDLHLKYPPELDCPKISTERGRYTGMQLHIMRLIYSLFRETMRLIRGRKELITSNMFQEVFRSLSKENKAYWTALVTAALEEGNGTTDFNKFLEAIRSKLTFHYGDLAPLGEGYKRHFFDENGNKTQDAFISRGLAMSEERFYFADAAIENAMKVWREGKEEEFRQHTKEYSQNIGAAIRAVVTNFIQNVRKAAWVDYPL